MLLMIACLQIEPSQMAKNILNITHKGWNSY